MEGQRVTKEEAKEGTKEEAKDGTRQEVTKGRKEEVKDLSRTLRGRATNVKVKGTLLPTARQAPMR